jgi:N-acetyl-gamma-glutamyl-phosphate reductase
MAYKVGILGIGGYGGGEALRLIVNHPQLQLVYPSGDTSAGQLLGERFPSLPAQYAGLRIEKWNDEKIASLDVVIASLPSGNSKGVFDHLPPNVKVLDIGGDHRGVTGWVYGLADIWPDKIKNQSRVANPGCYPAASIGALAPLIAAGAIAPHVIIDAKSGVSGAGRGGGSTFGYAEVNEDVAAYRLFKHPHIPEIANALWAVGGRQLSVVFTPHLVPMTRGLLATCYAHGDLTTEQCLEMAREFYADRPFVRVTDAPPHTKWALGTNMLFVSYTADPQTKQIIAIGAIDNLGKGAAGQAIQNINLMLGLDPTTGLTNTALWP